MLRRLLFWRRRPQHFRSSSIWPEPDRVVDMSAVIQELDPGQSMLQMLMMRLSGRVRKQPETLVEWASEIRRQREEWTDWERAWTEPSQAERVKVSWLEDELFPRVR